MAPENNTAPNKTANSSPQSNPSSEPAKPTEYNQLSTNAAPVKTSNKKKRSAILIGAVIAVVVLAAGSAGAYFGLYLPNQPDNIWKDGLQNTAKAYDTLVESTKKQEEKKGGTLKGDFKYDTKDAVIDGDFETKYNDRKSDTKLNVGSSGVRVSSQIQTYPVSNSKNPDVYLKVSGLKGLDGILGAQGAGIGQALTNFDNQWFVIDHTLLDQVEKSSGGNQSLPDFNQQDIQAIYSAVGKVNKEYIFTTDPTKAVLRNSQNIGEEQYDGRDAYHFKVAYDKQHLKDYVSALYKEMKNTKLSSLLTDEGLQNTLKEIDGLDANKQADAWVDLDTKLVRNVRIDTGNGATLDIGQKYNGGDEVPFVVGISSKESKAETNVTISVTANMKSDTVAFTLDGKGKQSNEDYSINTKGTLVPSNDEVAIQKPNDAKSLLEAYSQLLGTDSQTLLNSLNTNSSTNTQEL